MSPFHLDLNTLLLCFQCLLFYLQFKSDTFRSSQMISVNAAAWLRVGVRWWQGVAPRLLWVLFCLLVYP